MKTHLLSFIYTLTAFTLILMVSLSPVVFGETDATKKQEDIADSSDCKMKAYTDPAAMASAMADPAKFMQLMTLMSNTQTAQSMMECGMDSNQWSEIIANMSNPTNMMNAMAQFMNPQMYMNWMTASMNPATYQAAMNTFMNPALYMQWMTASMNPQFYAPMYKTMDTEWQQETTAWMMDPNSYQQMFGSMFGSMYQAPVVADAK